MNAREALLKIGPKIDRILGKADPRPGYMCLVFEESNPNGMLLMYNGLESELAKAVFKGASDALIAHCGGKSNVKTTH